MFDTASDTTSAMLPFAPDTRRDRPRWFAPGGCVLERGGRCEVVVNGLLIGAFERGDHGRRNALLVALSESPTIHLGLLAAAFGVSADNSREIRRLAEREGIESVTRTLRRGRKVKLGEAQRRKAMALFDEGLSAAQVGQRLGGRAAARTVQRLRTEWLSRNRLVSGAPRATMAVAEDGKGAATQGIQLEIATGHEAVEVATGRAQASRVLSMEPAVVEAERSEPTGVFEERTDDKRRNAATEVRSSGEVQHLGTWLMIAVLSQWKLHERVCALGAKSDVDQVRIALDAVVVALSIGEGCVEGARRVATPTAGALLRATWAPSASWTRQVLGSTTIGIGAEHVLPVVMARDYIARGNADVESHAVFYVDNHVRPYTGGKVVRKAWRMQDKRARPGTSDFYAHDEDGRPLFRLTSPENQSLTTWLRPIGNRLKVLCGEVTRALVCFDRGGAFAEEMAALRDEKIDFVTYQRKPYALYAPGNFDQEIVFNEERIEWTESRANLGKGRGRLRRISLRMSDGYQINLLASSDLDAPTLIRAQLSRWVQENGFKHAVARWGINQLDARKTEPYPPDAIIPNPARSRLDRALRAAVAQEGRARRVLSRAAAGTDAHASAEVELASSLAEQERLATLRPATPKHAPLRDTELAGKLVQHLGGYKTLIDSVRIACANVESDLALRLAPHLMRPREAKKTLANLLAAPGDTLVAADSIRVRLAPAATARERRAMQALLREVNAWNLTLPGDGRRILRFEVRE